MFKKDNKKGKIDRRKLYQWEGRNKKNIIVSGEMRVESSSILKSLLKEQNIQPLKVKEVRENFLFKRKRRVTAKEITIFTRQLATMIKAGVPLVKSFDIVAEGLENESLKEVVIDIKNEIASGTPFSTALRKHPKHFDDLFCNLVKAGEQSGSLEEMFESISIYKEKTEKIKAKIKKALIYPTIVLVASFAITVLLLVEVVPQFQNMFENFGGKLPAFTQLVVNLSDFFQSYWFLMMLFVIGISYLFIHLKVNSKLFNQKLDLLLLKTPVFGKIIKNASIARYTRTLATTFKAGVNLVDGIEYAAGASGNYKYYLGAMKIKDDVTTGQQLHFAMQNSKLFPPMVTQMTAIGEESGSLENMLFKSATLFEDEVDNSIDNLTSIMEPMIMVVLGVIIGGLLIAMYLPIFSMGSIVN